MLGDLREVVVAGDEDIGEGLIIPQQHIVARPKALDEIGLEQQRLDLALGQDDFQFLSFGHHPLHTDGQAGNLRVRADPALEVTRLADIKRLALGVEHTIDARPLAKRPHPRLEQRNAAPQVFRQRIRTG